MAGGWFDAVVLDEAQDLTDAWALALAGLLDERGRLVAFVHTEQGLFGAGAPIGELCEHTHTPRPRPPRLPSRSTGHAPPSNTSPATDRRYATCPLRPTPWAAPPHGARPAAPRRAAVRRRPRPAVSAHQPPSEAQTVADADAARELGETNWTTFKGRERPAGVLALDLWADAAEHAAEAVRTG